MKTSPMMLAIALVITIAIPVAVHGKSTSPSFVNIPLIRPDGGSEPELSIGTDGTTVFVSLSWTQFATNAWKASFGQTPAFQGQIDTSLAPGVGGGEDADVDLGLTGTLHATTLLAFFNPQTKITQLGVSAITCPNADLSNNFAHCTSQIVDTTQADRPWITSDGVHVYISYHDSGSSTTIHVQRSDDDGITFHRVGDPIVGQAGATGNSTFDNDQGRTWTSPIVVNVAPAVTAVFPWIAARGTTVDYVYYGTSASSKDDQRAVWNVYMARSTDGGAQFAQTVATSHPNHVGVICTNGIGCQRGTRNLLDLFQDAINPTNGLAAIIYTDDTLTTQSDSSPLPQVAVAYQTS